MKGLIPTAVIVITGCSSGFSGGPRPPIVEAPPQNSTAPVANGMSSAAVEEIVLDCSQPLRSGGIPLTGSALTTHTAYTAALSPDNGEATTTVDYDRLRQSGVIIGTVDPGTRAYLLETKGDSIRIRIASGDKASLEGWTAAAFMVKNPKP